jgi:hypothetical protein
MKRLPRPKILPFSGRMFFYHRDTEITEKKFLYKKLCVLCASVVKTTKGKVEGGQSKKIHFATRTPGHQDTNGTLPVPMQNPWLIGYRMLKNST